MRAPSLWRKLTMMGIARGEQPTPRVMSMSAEHWTPSLSSAMPSDRSSSILRVEPAVPKPRSSKPMRPSRQSTTPQRPTPSLCVAFATTGSASTTHWELDSHVKTTSLKRSRSRESEPSAMALSLRDWKTRLSSPGVWKLMRSATRQVGTALSGKSENIAAPLFGRPLVLSHLRSSAGTSCVIAAAHEKDRPKARKDHTLRLSFPSSPCLTSARRDDHCGWFGKCAYTA
mmetsp:Transcript_95391/g.278929  ORF Transcript_95391/g.278929 Transcript_95391/m.278929 type:complete len:229 (-) Transcript_95391:434-1120(-)